MTEMIVKITPTGQVQFIWDDRLRKLFDEGEGTITRASHVEPTTDGLWTADLSPVEGPTLGPFDTRKEALAAEISWLENNVICN